MKNLKQEIETLMRAKAPEGYEFEVEESNSGGLTIYFSFLDKHDLGIKQIDSSLWSYLLNFACININTERIICNIPSDNLETYKRHLSFEDIKEF